MKKFLIFVICVVAVLSILYWYNQAYNQGVAVNSFELPDGIYNVKLSPDSKYISYQTEAKDYQYINVEEKRPKAIVLNEPNDKSRLIGWGRKEAILFIKFNAINKTYAKSNTNFLYMFNTSTNEADRLPPLNSVSTLPNRYYFLTDDYKVYPFDDTYFFVVEENTLGKPSYLINSRTNNKTIFSMHKGRYPANIIFSKDGKLIAYEEKNINNENESLGVRIYSFRSNRYINIPKLKGSDRVVRPVAISDDQKWILIYQYKGNLESTPSEDEMWPLYAYDIEKSKLSRLRTKLNASEAQNVNWLKDDEHFIVLRKDGLYEYDLYKLLPRQGMLDAFSPW